MVAQAIVEVLALLHIFFAVGWLGGAMLFGFGIGPAIQKMSPAVLAEFFAIVAPRVLTFFRIVPVMTIAFGLLLLYAFTDGDFSLMAPTTAFGLRMSVGVGAGLLAFLVGEALAIPYVHKVIAIFERGAPAGGQGPPPEVLKALKGARITVTITVVLLIVTLIFMVGSAF